jgi:hypothetical protein
MQVTYPIFKKREELSRVHFSEEDFQASISGLLTVAPHLKEQVEPILVQLEAARSSPSVEKSCSLAAGEPISERRLEYIAANLIEHEKGFVWCAKCQRELKASGTVFERYERGRGRLDGGGGRRFFCGLHLHLLLEVVDFRS